jgi:hypothetical protein
MLEQIVERLKQGKLRAPTESYGKHFKSRLCVADGLPKSKKDAIERAQRRCTKKKLAVMAKM